MSRKPPHTDEVDASERRRHERFDLTYPLRFSISNQHQAVAGTLVNLSAEGAFIRSTALLTPGATFACGFCVAADSGYTVAIARGVVVWTHDAADPADRGFGVRLTQLTVDMPTLLAALAPDAQAA